MLSSETLRLLGLSRKELMVLDKLQKGLNTPVKISNVTNISRPAIYAILQNLKKRGLVESRIKIGKKQWHLVDEREIESRLYDVKRELLNLSKGRGEKNDKSDSTVVVHRGKSAVKALVNKIFFDHKGERFIGLQGDVPNIGWNQVFSIEETRLINQAIKKNGFIVESILPKGWFETQTKLSGLNWAKDFEGRTTRVNFMDPSYFEHGGQAWVFKKMLYLFDLSEEIIIEIRHSEIQKMILALFKFIQDNSRNIDVNQMLRDLIAKEESRIKLK